MKETLIFADRKLLKAGQLDFAVINMGNLSWKTNLFHAK